MHAQRSSVLLRHMMLGALFAASMLKARPAQGYTMVVWGDPDGWGCIGMCGESGYYEPVDWSGSGDASGGGGSGGETGDSADNPIDVPNAAGDCGTRDSRQQRASDQVRSWLAAEGRLSECNLEQGRREYYFVRFEGHNPRYGSLFQWYGDCFDNGRYARPFLSEISTQCPP